MTTPSSNRQSAFTIVEILVIIAVIAILASIVLLSYTSTQNRSMTASSQNLAEQVAKNLDSFKSVEGSYPTVSELVNNSGNGTARNPVEAQLEVRSSVGSSAPTATGTTAGTDYVQYVPCATSGYGGTINWYDYNNSRVTSTTTEPSSISVGSC